MLQKLKQHAGMIILIVIIIAVIWYFLKKKSDNLEDGESSFAPGPGAPPRGMFAPVPPMGGGGGMPPPGPPAPPPPPGPPGPPPPPGPPGPHPPHPQPPYPYPYPYFWGGPSYVYGLDIVDGGYPNRSSCFKRVTMKENGAERTVCLSRREYVLYVQGRRDYWSEKLKVAKTKNFNWLEILRIQNKLSRANDILASLGGN